MEDTLPTPWNHRYDIIVTCMAGMKLKESKKFFAEIKTDKSSFIDKLMMLGVTEDAIISAAKQLVIPMKQSYFLRLANIMKNGKN